MLWELDRWQARVDVEHASNQGRVPDNESGTHGYTTLGASAGYHFDVGSSQWLAFVKGDNLLAQRYETLKGFPMPRATVMAGVQIDF